MGQPHVADDLDRTEIRDLARQLGEERQRVAAVVDTALDCIVGMDAAGRITEFNPAAERTFGYRREDVLGRDMAEVLIPPAHREAHHAGLARYLATDEPRMLGRRVELTALRADGTEFPVELAITRLPAEGPPAFTAWLRDITDRRGTEAALRASEERFRALVEQLADAIVVIGGDSRVLYASPAVERITGFTREELTGAIGLGFTEPADLPAATRFLEELVRHPRESRRVELRVRRKNGPARTLAVTGTNLLDHPSVRGIVLNASDITERKDLEERFRQSQKMEAVGRLAGGVAHDFNNILTVITTTTGLLLEALPKGDVRRDDVLEIQKAANRAAGLTHQLLAVSRRQVLRPRTLDLNAAVRDMLAMLRRVIGEDVDLVTELEPGIGCVRADASQLAQVVLNLAVNARDAMPEGGRLTIRTGALELEEPEARRRALLQAGRWVTLDVSDAGVGMGPEVQSHLFEPFFTTKPAGTGTGLGLSTVYGIVEQSGGQIEVESAPGHGSTFTIYLPRVDAEPEGDGAERAAVPDAGRETILLVEDEAPVRALARRVLERKGYLVIEAKDGADALVLCERSPFTIDLLVTDVVMPGMNGRAVAECLRRERPDLRVLYMTGYTDDEIVRRGLKDESVALIQKPFAPDELTRRVRELLDQ